MPWPTTPPTKAHRDAYADAEPRPFWLSQPIEPTPALTTTTDADLCIVGGGFTGLWAALHAKVDDPARDVVVLEAETVGFGASGRNGGFAVASLTHGIENGLARFADEMATLERLALENFDGLRADLERHGIDCDFEPTGDLLAITDPYQDAWLEEEAETLRRFGHTATVLDQAAMQAEIASPTYRGGVWDHTGSAVLDPGKLATGLRDAALALGVRVHEHSAVHDITDDLHVLTALGRVRARKVLLATSAYPPLL
jgi:glycine/D-amino acid oxidase-like deaminating enzyme